MLKSLKKTERHNSNGESLREIILTPNFYTQTLNQVHLYQNSVSDHQSLEKFIFFSQETNGRHTLLRQEMKKKEMVMES